MSKIEWTDETYNPIIGCSHISPGCDNCYAERMANRLAQITSTYDNYGEVVNWLYGSCIGWNGKTHFVKSQLEKPLHWKKPRKIFVCSMGDLFHETVLFGWLVKVFDIIKNCSQHTFKKQAFKFLYMKIVHSING